MAKIGKTAQKKLQAAQKRVAKGSTKRKTATHEGARKKRMYN